MVFRKLSCLILALLFLVLSVTSCSKMNTTGDTPAPDDPTPSSPAAPEPTVKDKSPLTGLASSEAVATSRPVAVMIDNEVNFHSSGMNCLGLSSADIIYETNIEANYSGTRIMAVFTQDGLNNTEKVGSVRSARPYYMSLAKMLDAFYVHEGVSNPDEAVPETRGKDSDYARGLLEQGYIENFYLNLDGKTSYRDTDGALHSQLCTVENPQVAYGNKTVEFLNSKYSRSTYENGVQKTAFKFGENKLENGTASDGVKVIFANWNKFYTKSDFVYDADSGLYVRGQYLYGALKNRVVPTDLLNGKALTFTNVFVLVTEQHAIDKDIHNPDDDYHIKIDLAGHEGEGYYFTNGKYVKITWKCASDTEPMKFYNEDGSELTVNPGKSYVNLINSNALSDLEIR